MKNSLKPLSKFLLPVLIFCALFAADFARAAVTYWDPEGVATTPYTGNMTGTWENNSWSTVAGGTASPGAWVEATAACFGVATGNGTPAFTVTMNANHTVAGIFNGALAPNACVVTINGTGQITIPSGLQAFDMTKASDGSTASTTINVVLAGAGTVTAENGTGQYYFNAANTYSGGTQTGYSGSPFSGILNYNSSSSFGSGHIIVSRGYSASFGALVAEGTSAITLANVVDWSGSLSNAPYLNIVGGSGGTTFSGNWTLGNREVHLGSGVAADSVTISGVVSGTGSLTKFNPAPLILSGANTYSGRVTNSAGTLEIKNANSLGSCSNITVASGATLKVDSSSALNAHAQLNVATGTPVVNLNYSGTQNIGALSMDGGATLAANGTWGSGTSGAANTDTRFTGTGILQVGVVCSATNGIVSITSNGGGSYTLLVQGTQNAQYSIVSTNDPTAPVATWPAIPGSTTNLAPADGLWSITVTNAGPAFYRSKATTACP